MVELEFPPGTPVCVRQTVQRRDAEVECETVGVVEEWVDRATGSWFAGGKNDKLWLHRLRLRKLDGEQTLLVVDEHTAIARLEPVKS